jgi:hypothetical protein
MELYLWIFAAVVGFNILFWIFETLSDVIEARRSRRRDEMAHEIIADYKITELRGFQSGHEPSHRA